MGRTREETLWPKGEIRKYVLNIRDNMPAEDRERCHRQIRERVLGHNSYREAQAILAYASYRSEVDTAALIRQALADGKYVFVPKVAGAEMEFWRITSLEDLQDGYMGIPEPVQKVSFPEWMAGRGRDGNTGKQDGRIPDRVMMWMPGAAFDKERHRIGYGKGFYDRYLGRLSDARGTGPARTGDFRLCTAALAYTCQIVQKIPYGPHDIRPDMVVTENGILEDRE